MAENHQLRSLRSQGDFEEPVSAVSGSNSPTRRVSGLYDDPSSHQSGATTFDTPAAAAADLNRDETTSPALNAARRESGLRRVPVGSKSATVSPDLNRQSSFWSVGEHSQADRPLSPAWDNIASPWENRPAISHAYSSLSLGNDRVEEPMHRDHEQVQRSEKKMPAMTVGAAETVSVSSSERAPEAGMDAIREEQDVEDRDDEFDNELFYSKYNQPPSYCRSRGDIYTSRFSWLSITIFVLSVYSTVLSGIWLVTAIVQPRWGHRIASSGDLIPATATLVAALVAKTIELSFVTVFVSFLGQVLTRKSILRKTRGMTLAEMTMRNWVFQPGSLITHWETIPYAGLTLMGALALTATVASMFYTTASDAMVSPKLKYGNWEQKELQGWVRSSYANAGYVKQTCQSLLEREDEDHHGESCLSVQFSGQSYRDLLGFMSTWESLQQSDASRDSLSSRPAGNTLLYDNTTLRASWIEKEHSDIKAQFESSGRIINNVTMAYPHPGLYAAATHRDNGILQPADLGGVGEYSIHAGVASPAINVMCVNMAREELEPLVYTEWPDARTERTGVGNQTIGEEDWGKDVPQPLDDDGEDVFLNETVVDDIFRWGPKYGRRPPVFQLYPADYNLLTNSTVHLSDSIYMMGKNPTFDNYTLCELKSWMSPNCSSHFDVSGRSGASMRAHCEDADDTNSYRRSFPDDTEWSVPVMDWKWIADAWRTSMDLNGGQYNNNASNARILTQLSLSEPEYSSSLPSLAEALAVFASSTAVISAIDAPFVHFWNHEAVDNILDAPGEIERFNATLRTQQYTSGHVSEWHKLFYIILALVFGINCFCLVYLVLRSGLVTDFTEPQNLFALAVNSPPSEQLKGSCGSGPHQRDLVVPWRVAYAPSAEHYFFEEANAAPWRGKYAGAQMEAAETVPERKRARDGGLWKRKAKRTSGTRRELKTTESSYKRLSAVSKRTPWF